MDQQKRIQEIQNRLEIFRLNLPKNPSMSEYGIAMFSDHNRQDVQEILWARILNQMNDVLVIFENRTAWETIDVILFLISTSRINTINTILRLHELKRLNEIFQICELVKLNRWNEIYSIDSLAYQNRLDEITIYLSNIFNPQTLANIPSQNLELKSLINYTASAGLNTEQAQNINYMYGKSLIRTEERKNIQLNSAQIDVAKQNALNNEKLRYQKLQNDIAKVLSLEENSLSKINYWELGQSYIETNKLIRLSANGIFKIYKWDDKFKRYTRIDSNKTLNTDIHSYAYKNYGQDIEITSKEIDIMVNRMRHNTVPLLEESQDITESNEYQIFFLNGYYDLKKCKFNHGDTSQYFHTSTIPCIYDENAQEPEIFDNMLCRIFEEDKTKIKLAYQIIGAIISNVPLKYIYVFQGISNGGKSTLSECIIRLFNKDEVELKGSINELDENRVSSFERRIKLMSIDDSPSDKWSSATISYLKTRSRGVSSKKATMFKILLITNYAIGFKTENGRDESIENRIVILPFQKNMVSANEIYISDKEKLMTEKIKNYLNEGFDNEKSGIIKKSLLAFQEVLENDNNFTYRYPLNENINTTYQSNDSESTDKLFKNLILSNMEFTDNKSEYSKAKDIKEYLNQEIQQGRLKGSSLKIFDRPHEIGKLLQKIFCNELNSFRQKDETLYNLKFKL